MPGSLTGTMLKLRKKMPLAIHERPSPIVARSSRIVPVSPGWLWHRAIFDSTVAVALLAGQNPYAHS
jgi:hypothetical protein